MTGLFECVLAETGGGGLILPIGVAVFGGTVGAKIIQRYHIPQIIGYILIGVILGPMLGFISQESIGHLEPFNIFALGIIGFLVGGELEREIFAKFGRQVALILLFEGLMAFLLVGILSFTVMIFFAGWQMSLAVAVVFAAICAATDPASTVSVLWEYKARGPLTAMLTAIVALDDALALVLYAIGVSVAGVITGHQEQGLWSALGSSLFHIAGALALGAAAAIVLIWILKRTDDPEKVLAFTVGAVLVIIGIAANFHLDVIIATMALGVVLVNVEPRRMASCFSLMHRFSAPVYVLFFVLVGARLKFSGGNSMIWLLVIAYVVGSVVGKTGGSYVGAAYSKTVKSVRNYLGFCLYPQGGIAVGLLIMASRKFDSETSALMLLVVIIGAFILQIIGPLGVKFGARKAGEIGLNITEDDLVKKYSVGEVMDTKVPVVGAGMSLSEVIKVVGSTDSSCCPVVDKDHKLIGGITLDGIRNTFSTQELNDWLVAIDIAEPVVAKVTPEEALSEALERIKQLDIEYLPVVTSGDGDKHVGILSLRSVRRRLGAEVLAKQKEADKMYGLAHA
ncbi:MAG: cation:proton antiporter [Phycisphaerales bacterium]|nr:MAG: cation:proton antiporter [Phycisphaerales bacterium]